MELNITQKLIQSHLVVGEMIPGKEIGKGNVAFGTLLTDAIL